MMNLSFLAVEELPLALEKAAAVLQGVLRHTMSVSSARTIGGKRVPPDSRRTGSLGPKALSSKINL